MVRQPSFAAGLLAPTLWGRTDLARYGAGFRNGSNFLVGRHGSLVSRPGLRFLALAGSQDASEKVRLVPFVVANDDALVLEFSNAKIRFFKNRTLVLNGGLPYERSAPYADEHLAGLRFAQSGDSLFIAHPEYPLRELRRVADNNWTIEVVSLDLPSYTAAGGRTGILPNEHYLFGPAAGRLTYADAGDSVAPQEWRYAVTVVREEVATGRQEESLPVDIAVEVYESGGVKQAVYVGKTPFIVSQKNPVQVVLADDDAGAPPTSPAGWRVVATRYYRGRGDLLGFIGQTEGPQTYAPGTTQTPPKHYLLDYGSDPDYSRPPPKGRNPLVVFKEDGTIDRTENPVAVGFFEQRLVLAGTKERPSRVWLSRTDSFLDFDEPPVLTDDQAIEVQIASYRREAVRAVLGQDRLMLLCAGSIFSLTGPQGAPLTATSVPEVRQASSQGIGGVDPLQVGPWLLYASTDDRTVYALQPADERRGYEPRDLTFFADHLTRVGSLVAWAYAREPWSVLWCVRSDGVLLSLTLSPEEGIIAWAQHTTDGVVEAVASVPRPDGFDDVLVAVRRTTRVPNPLTPGGFDVTTIRTVEAMMPRHDRGPAFGLPVCLDSCWVYTTDLTDPDANATGGPVTEVTGLAHLEGKDVAAVVGGVVYRLTVAGGKVTLPVETPVGTVAVGLEYAPEAELLDVAQARDERKRVSRVTWEVVATAGLQAGPDFDHLTEAKVREVADDYGPLPQKTGRVEVRLESSYSKTGRAVLRQADPLPCMVVGVTREVDVGG